MTDKSLKIVALEGENFKKIRAVRIVPKGPVIEIAGQNGQGKTSTLDLIWATLGGAKASPEVPIRQGETEARAFLDLGDLKLTRRWWFKSGTDEVVTDLRVETAEGARFSKGQDAASALVGRMTFDPLEFTRWPAEKQFEVMRGFVEGFDFDRAAGLNKRDYEDRTDVNRETKRLEAEAAGITLPAEVPAPVDLAALENALGEAANHNAEVATRKGNRQAASQRVLDDRERGRRLREEAAALIDKAEEAEGAADALQQQIDKAEALPEPIDVSQVQADLAAARETNAIAERAARKADLLAKAAASQERSDALSAAIDARKAEMEKAVAEAKMPVPGISFGDEMVLLNGLPFAQASKAEKLRASIAIASALSPRLRVLRIEEGVFLDADARRMVEKFAAENDMQIWIEVVGAGGPDAIVIEDGGIKEAAADPVSAEEIEDVV